jgi:hypothetical protein
MNIKYAPQKSEKFSFTGLLLGCIVHQHGIKATPTSTRH